MKKGFFSLILLPLSIVVLISSCDSQMVYDDFQDIEGESWHWDDVLDFSIEVQDTISIHDILIRLRHSTDYPLSNLYMFVNIEGPSGQTETDTINYILAENSGKWIGSGVGNIREIGYLYKKNVRFPESGLYKVSIEQAMRLSEIPVGEVGVRIEKINQ
ncbi:MAG: gliding motility lipoprotein GldH [Bacteroidales bacterium]|jgi:gliding motility-associated lipoprotein GldH|nr:gliding motility lipoprotein GldH [Bacteroidales bacterium]